MPLDPRTPVCIGAAVASQRFDDPAAALEPAALIIEAVRAAGRDAGVLDALSGAQLVAMAGGTWAYRNCPRLVAEAIGAPGARTHLIVPGVLQTGLFDRALSSIATGALDLAVVCGGEAQFRELRGRITGAELAYTDDRDAPPPDEVVRPHGHVISPQEVARRMVDAPTHYAMLETARRVADGQSVAEHRELVARFWAGFNQVAQTNPNAWNPTPMTAAEIATTTAKNRLIAHPYNKWHVSQQNVDQAAALVFCSVARAEALGVPRERWVFPHAIVDSNHMVPLTQRAVMHRSPGFATAGARAFALAGVGPDDLAHIDLYSCFPIAARTQVLELGLDIDRPLTVTGGMAFCGGPLNNYVVQSTAAMMQVLRRDPGSRGLVTAISGMITKQGVSIWSTEPPAEGYRFADVTDEVAPLVGVVPTAEAAAGRGPVLTYTVNADADGPRRAVALVDLGTGARALVVSDDRTVAAHMVADDCVGAQVHVHPDDTFTFA